MDEPLMVRSMPAEAEGSLLDLSVRETSARTARGSFRPPDGPARLDLIACVVVAADDVGDTYLLQAAGERVQARRAAGCLLAPAVGDNVLAVWAADRPTMILSVLERADAVVATVSVPGAETLRIAAAGLLLQTEGTVDLEAGKLKIAAEAAQIEITETHFFGRAATLVLTTADAILTTLRLCADKLVSRSVHSLRMVDEVDSTVAQTVLVQAGQSYTLQAKQALVSASGDVRIDGERISMG